MKKQSILILKILSVLLYLKNMYKKRKESLTKLKNSLNKTNPTKKAAKQSDSVTFFIFALSDF